MSTSITEGRAVEVEPSQFGGSSTPRPLSTWLRAPVWALRIQFHKMPATDTGRICGR